MLAELAVGDPRRTLVERLERERIDQDGPGIAELDVVRRRVLELPAFGHRVELRVERQERGIAQLAEGPLVRIADELDLLGPDDRVGVGALGLLDRDGLVRDEPVTVDEPLLERARLEGVPLRRETALDLAVGLAVLPEDEAARVAERAGVPLGGAGPAAGSVPEAGVAGSATPGAVMHRRGRLVLVAATAHHAQEPTDLVPEEERHGDRRRDRGLDDEAAGARIDVREFKHVRGSLRSWLTAR